MTSDNYGAYTGTSQPQYYNEVPVDVPLYQTPSKALSHPHFIKSVILGSVAGFLINWGIGALFQLGKDRLFLWTQPKAYTVGIIDVKAGSPLWLEILLTVTLSVFLGHPLNSWGAKGDLRKAQAVPIQGHDLKKYRFLGVTIKNSWLRALVFTIFSTMIVYSAVMLMMFYMCDHNILRREVIPPDLSPPGECYMVKKYYIILKGVIAALAALVICWIAEWAILNRDNIDDDVFDEYVKARQEAGQQQQITKTQPTDKDSLLPQ